MAITDVFFRRYTGLKLIHHVDERTRTFLFQAVKLVTRDLWIDSAAGIRFEERTRALEQAYTALATEIGKDELVPHYETVRGVPGKSVHHRGWLTIVTAWMDQQPATHQDANLWLLRRISLIELILKEFERQKAQYDADYPGKLSLAELEDQVAQQNRVLFLHDQKAPALRVDKIWLDGRLHHVSEELDSRFAIAGFKLSFHNGLIQEVDDALVAKVVAKPFWNLVADQKWINVDTHIKQALDERDKSVADAHYPALQALESVIKILSDEKGWSTGNERGAAGYIQNLVKERSGVRFIATWEADMLINLFSKVRNPHGHGPGSRPLDRLTIQQTEWAIDTAMVWIKSLVGRT